MMLVTLCIAFCTLTSALMEHRNPSALVEASKMLYFTRSLQELGENETIHDDEDLLHLNDTDHHDEMGEHDEDEHHDEMDDHHDEDEHHEDDHDGHDHGHDHGHDDDHGEHEEDFSLLEGLNEGSSSDIPWAEVIVAALLINLITLMGVFFLTGEFIATRVFKKDVSNSPYYQAFTHNIIPSFACGALLATNFFLVLPEALYLITAHFTSDSHEDPLEEGHEGHAHRLLEEAEDDHEDDADALAVWRFGTCVIAGFLLPILTSAMFPHNHDASDEVDSLAIEEEKEKLRDIREDDAGEKEQEGPTSLPLGTTAAEASNFTAKSAASSDVSEVVVSSDDKALPYPINWSLAASIMAGDFFHNFAGKC